MDSVVTMVSVFHVTVFPIIWNPVSAIDCYECYSFNGSDKSCGDPFHPAYGNLKKYCTQGKERHIGQFPANYCIKLIGNITDSPKLQMVYRGCSLLSLDSQCGDYKFEDIRYKGCVMSCKQNGCNIAPSLTLSKTTFFVFCIVMIVWKTIFKTFQSSVS